MSMLAIIGNLAAAQTGLRARMDLASRQVATGQIGERHGDLGASARRAIDLRGDIARREAYVQAIGTAQGRMSATQEVLGRLERLASDLAADALRARTLGSTGVDALANAARAALEEAAALMNTRHAGEYLLAGANLTVAPLPDAAGIATGPMATAIAAAVAGLGPDNAAEVLAGTQAAAAEPGTSPFDAALEAAAGAEPARALRVADAERVAWGVLANRDQAGEVAQSWGRELLRHLATLAAMRPETAAQGAGYQQFLQGVATGLSEARAGLGAERTVLGGAEARVAATRERHENLLVALRNQVRDVEEVDLAEASAALRQLQVRLEASYESTALVSRLSLAALLR